MSGSYDFNAAMSEVQKKTAAWRAEKAATAQAEATSSGKKALGGYAVAAIDAAPALSTGNGLLLAIGGVSLTLGVAYSLRWAGASDIANIYRR